MDKATLRPLIDDALKDLRANIRPGQLFMLAAVAKAIEETSGVEIPESAHGILKDLMLARWGQGVVPATMGGHYWKFGYGKPPKSAAMSMARRG